MRRYFELQGFVFYNIMDLILNNYCVYRYFDNHFDGYSSDFNLSEKEANSIKNGLSKNRKHLTSYEVVEHTSILGIVKFNDGKAYVFNKVPSAKKGNVRLVTVENYESLMNCYVYCSQEIEIDTLKTLEDSYYKLGGVFYEKYRDFEKTILYPEREKRNKLFYNEIKEHIFKHDFREVSKKTWSNGKGVVIKKVFTNRMSIDFKTVENHIDLRFLSIDEKVFVGSIFSIFSKEFRQLSEKKISIPCIKNDKGYYHNCFEITFN